MENKKPYYLLYKSNYGGETIIEFGTLSDTTGNIISKNGNSYHRSELHPVPDNNIVNPNQSTVEVETFEQLTESEIEKHYTRCEFDDECDVCKNPEHGSYAVNLFDGECDSYICGKCATKAIPKLMENMAREHEYFEKLSKEYIEADNQADEFIAMLSKEPDGNYSHEAVRFLGSQMANWQKSKSTSENEKLKAESWIYTKDKTPLAYQTGNWDGTKSDLVVAEDSQGKKHLAVVYEGTMDGHEYLDWYDDRDFLLPFDVIRWFPIPY